MISAWACNDGQAPSTPVQLDGLGQRCRRPSVGSTWSGEAAAGGRRRAKDDRRRSPCTRVEDSASQPRSTCVREPHDCRPPLRGCSHLLYSTRHKGEAPGEGARPQRRRKAPRELGADQQLPVGPTAEAAHTDKLGIQQSSATVRSLTVPSGQVRNATSGRRDAARDPPSRDNGESHCYISGVDGES